MTRHLSAADLPEDIARIAEAQVAAGKFASVEDVVRAGVEAIEQDSYRAKLARLRAAIDEGDSSGIFDGDPFAEVRSRRGLSGASRPRSRLRAGELSKQNDISVDSKPLFGAWSKSDR
jgi:antitoxin ParD1/3/4